MSPLPGGSPPAAAACRHAGTTRTRCSSLLPRCLGPVNPVRSRATAGPRGAFSWWTLLGQGRGRARPRNRVVCRMPARPNPGPSRARDKARGTAHPVSARVHQANPTWGQVRPNASELPPTGRGGGGKRGCTCLGTPLDTESPQHVHVQEAPLPASVLGTISLPNTRAVT